MAEEAMMRIEAARRIFPRCWFNETRTEAGRDALGYYHERRDENRNVGLVRITTGRATLRMHSATWRSVTRSRQLADQCCRARRDGYRDHLYKSRCRETHAAARVYRAHSWCDFHIANSMAQEAGRT
jgi:hypothetical protein